MSHKILHIITRWMKSGGAERNTYFTIKNSIYESDLLIGGDSDSDPKDIGVIKIKELGRNICPRKDIISLIKIYKVIKRNNYSLIHTHQSKAGIIGRVAGKLAGAKIIHTVHGSSFSGGQGLYKILEKIIGYFTDYFIFVGEDLKKHYIKNKISKESNSEVIRSYIDFDRLNQSTSTNSSKMIIGFIGRMEKLKGWDEAIYISKKILEKTNTEILFIGSGSLEEELKEKAKGLNIKFTGFREDIEDVIKSLDLFITPYSKKSGEGISQVLVQSSYLNIPTLSYNFMGAKEILNEEYIFENREELVEEALKLINNKESYKKKKIDYSLWNKDTISRQNNDIYTKILNQ